MRAQQTHDQPPSRSAPIRRRDWKSSWQNTSVRSREQVHARIAIRFLTRILPSGGFADWRRENQKMGVTVMIEDGVGCETWLLLSAGNNAPIGSIRPPFAAATVLARCQASSALELSSVAPPLPQGRPHRRLPCAGLQAHRVKWTAPCCVESVCRDPSTPCYHRPGGRRALHLSASRGGVGHLRLVHTQGVCLQ